MTYVENRSTNRAVPNLSVPEITSNSIIELKWRDGVLRRFRWGRCDAFGTPAYWVTQTHEVVRRAERLSAGTVVEELCFCLLGGYGVTAEMNAAAYRAVARSGLIATDSPVSPSAIESVLREPLVVLGHDKPIRYRFPRQRAERLSNALKFITIFAGQNLNIRSEGWGLLVAKSGDCDRTWAQDAP